MAALNHLRGDNPGSLEKPGTFFFMGISVILHLAAFLAFQVAVESKNQAPLSDQHVELEYASEAEPQKDNSATQSNQREWPQLDPAVEEETIALDTKDIRYSQYAAIIREKIMSKWVYPPDAKDQGLEGHVFILFTIEKDGRLTANKISSSSSHPQLDREAKEAVRRASPFPPFFSSMKLKRLHVNAYFYYSLRPHALLGHSKT
ncbi:MAG: hypothetical protein COX16_16600 [Deltaproteobacteria bacterium CG23_combo_of_CG06-09_8_20_14_all_51_20]|nr:MAG: hypothetical protein COX16_16600 [Deltaproteobacteria bacterium CG23_combo_of_CG06-09_8_20_14_all_51_20]PJB38714.1 MAG: hypothetical protein CO107_01725 [Deltaproteobacteria bacterium CG_4_9_14_3_um_filter_51_14]